MNILPGNNASGRTRLLRTLVRVAVMFVLFFPPIAAATNVFRVPLAVSLRPADLGLASRDLAATTPDGLRLSGWLVPAATARPRGAVLVCHGVGSNKGFVLPRARFLATAGYTCALFDFRCHGESQGRRVSYGLRERDDLRAMLDVLRREAPGLELGVLAESMGAAIAVQAAGRCPEVKAYVLDSCFTSVWDMARENFRPVPDAIGIPLQYAVTFFGSLMVGASILDASPQDALPTLEPRPVLFIHGLADRLIPPEHSVRLHRLYRGPKELWLVPDAPHTASHSTSPAEFERRVLAHFARHLSQ